MASVAAGRSTSISGDATADFDRRHPGVTFEPVAVIVPAFCEEASVASVVASVPREMAGLGVTVLVVDDGSTDRTAEVAAGAGALVCQLPSNCGQGAALRTGYRVALDHGARILATLDADGQWSAADLPAMVGMVATGRADLVNGSRRLGSDEVGEPLRRLGVVVFAAAIRLLTRVRVTDPANGLRAMTSDVAAGVDLRQPQYQSAELLVSALCRGFRYAEVGVGHKSRSAGRTKKGSELAYGLRFARVVAGTWRRERAARRARPAD